MNSRLGILYKQIKEIVITKHLTIALIVAMQCFISSAQMMESLQQTAVKFSSTNLTVEEALDAINNLPDISIVYNDNEVFLKINVVFPKRTMTVYEALNETKLQAPVDILFNHNYVIIKARKLADDYSLEGTVKDDIAHENLITAALYVEGTTIGAVTDTNGNFILRLKPGEYKLICQYLGYKDKKLTINLYQDRKLEILLETKLHELPEVNVIGTRREVEDIERGRTIEKIDAKTINRLSTNDVNDALHGRIKGVWTTKVSGAPGDHNKIRIRGISSILGSTDPLYVVDGMIIPVVNFKTLGISDLNTHDIKSITVLKDASSTALYGYLGGNGVILIETKKGGGETLFNLNMKKGYQQFTKRYPLMRSETFLSTLDSSDSHINTRFYKIYPSQHIYEKYPYYRDSLGNTLGSENFQEELFDVGEISEVQLSGQGSLKTVDYFLSGNYYNHDGIITHSNYSKYSLTANLSKTFREALSVSLLYKASFQKNKNNLDNYMGNNVILKGINYEPAYRTTPDSFLFKYERLFYNDFLGGSVESLSDHLTSPDKLFYQQEKKKIENSQSGNLTLYYPFHESFSLRASYSLAFKGLQYTSFIPAKLNQKDEKFLLSDENFMVFNQQYDLGYEKLINNHSISAFIRYRNYKDNVYWKVDSVLNVELEGLQPEDDIYLRGSQAIYGEKGSVIRAINSAIANINYNYKKKYSLSLIMNLDHLKEGYYVDKTELFSSLALDWDISKERFLHIPSFIDAFHLYVNWGQAGNYPLNSLSNDLYSASTKYTANDDVVTGAYISNLANHHLTHEKVTEQNYGTEITALKSRIIISVDYYVKHNSDLLIQRTIPIYYGGGVFYQNIGEMKNSGVEISLELTPVDRPNFAWITRTGYSTNNQYITRLYEGEPISFNYTDVLYPDFYAEENKSLGSITGYSYQGVWNDEVHSNAVNGKQKYIKHMGLAYLKLDIVNRQKITENDKTVIGNSIPDFTCNWINIIKFKNFTFEMLWYAVAGVDKYNATKASTYITGTNAAVRGIVLDTMNYITDKVFYESSFFVEDASFIRLKTLSLTYTQPKKFFSRIGAEYTLSFENLLTITHYTGYDPEATIYTSNNFSDNAMDRGSYPNPRGIYFCINLSF
jgi:TonB-linked SusC/RagA family outer membrane protein